MTSPDAAGPDSGSQAIGSLDVGVVTFAGDPVANAKVFVRGTTISATTDAMGIANFSDVPVGDVVVTAQADGGIEVHAPATIAVDETTSVLLNSPSVQSTTVTPSATTTPTAS